eukprot:m.69739 g.69739  ORF g.69739 m.69739 type:complete len:90 (+) comp9978_c0_seq5:48-317(+)
MTCKVTCHVHNLTRSLAPIGGNSWETRGFGNLSGDHHQPTFQSPRHLSLSVASQACRCPSCDTQVEVEVEQSPSTSVSEKRRIAGRKGA